MREDREALAIVAVLSLIYVVLSYVVSKGVGGSFAGAVALLLLLIPVPGAVAFLYGSRRGGSLPSFLLGFFPPFLFFMSGALFGAFEGIPLFSGLFLGACSGAVGYSGAVRQRGEGDWVVFALIGALLWFIVMLRVV